MAPCIVAAQIDPPFIRPLGKHMIIASVNLPAERLKNVWVSIGSAGEAAMSWDSYRGKWASEWVAPTRATEILDAERAFVWAITKDGILSGSYAIAIQWMLTEQST